MSTVAIPSDLAAVRREPAPRPLRYVLVTPARNEEAFLESTIHAMLAQTVRPARWVIVSDGSTDRTDDIARRYAAGHPWIELLRMPTRRDRQFAAKARCFNTAYERLAREKFDLVGNVDADITFPPDYFEYLLGRFGERPLLGVAGTPFVEDDEHAQSHRYGHRFANPEHVSGACQLFRRDCFEAVGGYVPIKGGAIDWVAVTTARMLGWETRTFTGRVCFHHRPIGTGNLPRWLVPFHYGRKAYYVGGHPAWALLRGCFHMKDAPWVLGGLLFHLGFAWAAVTRTPRVVSRELMAFHRREQMTRLRSFFARPASPAAPLGEEAPVPEAKNP